MDLALRGKRAIVTGGGRGIGKAVARALALEGAHVVIAARTRDALEATARELSAETKGTIVPLVCDTGVDASVRAMVEAAVAKLGGIDILVNCAAQPGGQKPPPKLAELTDEAFWADMNVKVMGYVRCIREAVPHMPRGGRIVNVSGLAARHTGSIIGSMRNVAVSALTKNVADELAERGITAVVVHPGGTRTEAMSALLQNQAATRGITVAEAEQRMARNNLLGRIIDATEVAEVIAFLASPKAAIINGDSVAVGGGAPGPISY